MHVYIYLYLLPNTKDFISSNRACTELSIRYISMYIHTDIYIYTHFYKYIFIYMHVYICIQILPDTNGLLSSNRACTKLSLKSSSQYNSLNNRYPIFKLSKSHKILGINSIFFPIFEIFINIFNNISFESSIHNNGFLRFF
jgi:hypothetical protein